MKTVQVALLASLLSASTVQAQDIWILDSTGGGDFTQPQAAINAAGQRDTILVRPGTYTGFSVTNKALQIIRIGGEPSDVVFLNDIVVQSLPTGRDVWIQGLRASFFLGDDLASAPSGGIVFLQDCDSFAPQSSDVQLLEVRNNLAGLLLTGGNYQGQTSSAHGYQAGGDGLSMIGDGLSRVVAWNSAFLGGTGADGSGFGTNPGGMGGAGVSLSAGRFFHTTCSVVGGDGGWGDPIGSDGPAFFKQSGAVETEGTSAASSLNMPPRVVAGSSFPISIEGVAGAQAVLLSSTGLQTRELSPEVGVLALRSPLGIQPLGTIAPGGVLETTLTAPSLSSGAEGECTYYQLMIIEGSSRYLGEVQGQLIQ